MWRINYRQLRQLSKTLVPLKGTSLEGEQFLILITFAWLTCWVLNHRSHFFLRKIPQEKDQASSPEGSVFEPTTTLFGSQPSTPSFRPPRPLRLSAPTLRLVQVVALANLRRHATKGLVLSWSWGPGRASADRAPAMGEVRHGTWGENRRRGERLWKGERAVEFRVLYWRHEMVVVVFSDGIWG